MSTTVPDHLRAKLTPGEVGQVLETCFRAGRAPMLHGDPGIGKSMRVQQIADKMFAEKYGYKLDEFGAPVLGKTTLTPSDVRPWFRGWRTATKDAVDIVGLPAVKDGGTIWAVPADLPIDSKGGVLFFDEINRGSEMTANACFNLLDRQPLANGYVLPQTWCAAAAVNDLDTGVRRLQAALTRRFTHYDMGGEVTGRWLEDVCQYGAAHNWNSMVLAFLRSFPAHLNKFDPKERVGPNPRAWEFMSSILDQQPSANLLHAHAIGNVGEGVGREFVAFTLLYQSLPNIDAIITGPDTVIIPDKASAKYAVTSALARRASIKNFSNIIKYLDRLPVEFSVAGVVDAIHRTPALQHLPVYTSWAIKHPNVLC